MTLLQLFQGCHNATYFTLLDFLAGRRQPDVLLAEVDFAWLSDFESHLYTVGGTSFAEEHLRILNGLLQSALQQGLITRNPLEKTMLKYHNDPNALDAGEAERLVSTRLSNPRLEQVRALMLSTYLTGRNTPEMQSVTPAELKQLAVLCWIPKELKLGMPMNCTSPVTVQTLLNHSKPGRYQHPVPASTPSQLALF
jgi:hypothetical protein